MKLTSPDRISNSCSRLLDRKRLHRRSLSGPGGLAGLLAAMTLALLGLALVPAWAGSQAGEQAGSGGEQAIHLPGVRIGTYDSRAIAVAYARSEQFAQQLQVLRRQRAEAAKAADQERVQQLETQGQSMQIRLNLQGFSSAPVDDVLDTVRDKIPAIARQKNVVAITRVADYHDDSVELVDVTDELAALFGPNDQTLKIIRDLRKQAPVAIEVAAKMPANQ